MKKTLLLLLVLTTLLSACVMKDSYSVIAPGKWRGYLKLDGSAPMPLNKKAKLKLSEVNFEAVSQGECPFGLEVVYETETDFYINIYNGEEVIQVSDIVHGHDLETADDTLLIQFPHYNSYIRAVYQQNVMQGEWVVETKDHYRIPFVAHHGKWHRFTHLKKQPITDISGKWSVTFGVEGDSASQYPAIGEFKQEGNKVTGTFMTETGDYRFLEGTLQANKLYLSCFDGSHAFLFEAKLTNTEEMIGSFLSGKHYKTLWSAQRNPAAKLRNPSKITQLKLGETSINFKIDNEKGQPVSLQDSTLAGKVRIVQLLGTWCPNCVDETQFLADYLKAHPSEDLAVVGLAFEKWKEAPKAWGAIRRFQKKYEVPYPILWAGNSDKATTSALFPQLNAISSYPTLIIIGKDNNIDYIHTGFLGPATSEYTHFKAEFHEIIQKALAK